MSKTERLEKNPEGKNIYNKTQLYIDDAEEKGIIHRDYGSHFFRWTHIAKFAAKLCKQQFNILDIGCGDFPLLKVLYRNKFKPNYYLGIDIRDMSDKKNFNPNFENEFLQIDIVKEIPRCKYGNWTMITFLEVIEHFPKECGIKVLDNIMSVMNSETYLFLSTPVFNGKAAQNHVFEWEHQELKDELEKRFIIDGNYGTFASQSDIEPLLSEPQREIYEKLKEYYDSNVLSIIFSPMFPQSSRNSIWRLKLK